MMERQRAEAAVIATGFTGSAAQLHQTCFEFLPRLLIVGATRVAPPASVPLPPIVDVDPAMPRTLRGTYVPIVPAASDDLIRSLLLRGLDAQGVGVFR
jgi:hypothetical protein